MRQNHTKCTFLTSDSWVILSPIEQSIKRKIEAVGTPLSDWNINIYRGVLTGYNDAFIIDTAKREEILSNCKSEDEKKRTAELIRPILRGRDIKRYSYEWAGLYLIATFPAKHYDIEQYPAIKKYLLSMGIEKLEQTGKIHIVNGEKIKARKKTNNKWFETQDSISYWDDFSKPKIVYAELARTGNAFAMDLKNHLVGNTAYIITSETTNDDILYHLYGILNSRITLYCLDRMTTRFDDNGWRWLRQFVEHLYIPKYNGNHEFVKLVKSTNSSNQTIQSEQINEMVARFYGLNEEELCYINRQMKGY